MNMHTVGGGLLFVGMALTTVAPKRTIAEMRVD